MPIRQLNNAYEVTPALTAAFERTMSPERWRTYRFAAGFNENLAHRLYLWNAAVGQSFHFPLQTVEVSLRNVISSAISAIYGPHWTTEPGIRSNLQPHQLSDILKAEQRFYGIHGHNPNTSQTVASLSVGFWVALLRRHYHPYIWETETANAFPHLAGGETIAHVAETGTTIQDLRNRIFHQEPLIGRNLSGDYGAILKMLRWICPHTLDWMRAHSSVPVVIRERPR